MQGLCKCSGLFSNGITISQSLKLINFLTTTMKLFLMRKQSDFQTFESSCNENAAFPMCVITEQEPHHFPKLSKPVVPLPHEVPTCRMLSSRSGKGTGERAWWHLWLYGSKYYAGVSEERSKGAWLMLNTWPWQDCAYAGGYNSYEHLPPP